MPSISQTLYSEGEEAIGWVSGQSTPHQSVWYTGFVNGACGVFGSLQQACDAVNDFALAYLGTQRYEEGFPTPP